MGGERSGCAAHLQSSPSVSASERREVELKAKVTELEESLRDMTFHFESQIKILQKGESGELVGGQKGSVYFRNIPPLRNILRNSHSENT